MSWIFQPLLPASAQLLASAAGPKTTTAAGNWSSGSTWVGGVKPAPGDDVVILHDVTVDEAIDIGAGTASTDYACLTITDATLTFSPSLSHTIRGGIVHEGAAIFQVDSSTGTGVTIEFDCPVAYEWRTANGHNSGAKVILTGGASSRVTIQSKSGGSNIWIRDGDDADTYLQGGWIQAQYTNFTRIGDATNPLARISATGDADVYFLHCRMDSCGSIGGFYNIGSDATFRIEDCNFSNTVGDSVMQTASAVSISAGTRTFLRNSCDKIVYFYAPYGFQIESNVFYNSYGCSEGDWLSFDDNLVRVDNGIAPHQGPMTNNMFIHSDTAQNNPHYVQAGYYTDEITGNIFYSAFTGSNGEGDCVQLGTPSSATTVTVKNNIVLRAAGGETSGTILSALGNSNTTAAVTHNTVFVGTQAALAVGETHAGTSGMITAFKSNICYSDGSNGYKIWDSGTDDSVTDLITSSNADYNCGFGLLTGSNLKGYHHLEFSSGSPGANDVDEDPGFVDDTRNPVTFDTLNGGAGSLSNFFTEFLKLNLSTYDSAYNTTDLLAHIRAGMTPTNANLDSAGHDGADIGAVSFTPSAGNTVDAPLSTLTITSNAPTIATTESHFVAGALATLSITTNAPTTSTTENNFVAGAVQALSITQNAPSVATTENHFIVGASQSISITENAPTLTVAENHSIQAPSVALSTTLNAPSISTTENHFIAGTSQALTITENAPTASTSELHFVDAAAANLSITTNAPTILVAENHDIALPSVALTTTANASTLSTTENHFVAGSSQSLTITADAPSVAVSENHFIAGASILLSITENAPTINASANNAVSIPSLALSITDNSPAVVVTENCYCSIPVATLAVSGFPPTINNGVEYGGAVISATVRRRRERAEIRSYQIAVDSAIRRATAKGYSFNARKNKSFIARQ